MREINIYVGDELTQSSFYGGVTGESKSCHLNITFSDDWANLTKSITFFDALGERKTPFILLPEDGKYSVFVASEAMAYDGEATFVIDGTVGDTRLRTAQGKLVIEKSPEGIVGTVISPTVAEQLTAAINAEAQARTAAINTEAQAREAADTALQNGKVSKSGDTMTGMLGVNTRIDINAGEAADDKPDLVFNGEDTAGTILHLKYKDSGKMAFANDADEAITVSGIYCDDNSPNDATANKAYVLEERIARQQDVNELNIRANELETGIQNEASIRQNEDTIIENFVGELSDSVEAIKKVIPSQATVLNKLADKSFVNSSIATNTANFIGTFNSLAELQAYSGTKTNNDYAFVVGTDSAGNTAYKRYKWNGSEWVYEYTLNNSSFTAAQWAAIQSGITAEKVAEIAKKVDKGGDVMLAALTIENVHENGIRIAPYGYGSGTSGNKGIALFARVNGTEREIIDLRKNTDGVNEACLISRLNANNRAITGVPTPTSGTDAANKAYVDTRMSEATVKRQNADNELFYSLADIEERTDVMFKKLKNLHSAIIYEETDDSVSCRKSKSGVLPYARLASLGGRSIRDENGEIISAKIRKVGDLYIPLNITNLSGYGESDPDDPETFNEVDFERSVYRKKGHICDGKWVSERKDIHFPQIDNSVRADSIVFESDAPTEIPVPNRVIFERSRV